MNTQCSLVMYREEQPWNEIQVFVRSLDVILFIYVHSLCGIPFCLGFVWNISSYDEASYTRPNTYFIRLRFNPSDMFVDAIFVFRCLLRSFHTRMIRFGAFFSLWLHRMTHAIALIGVNSKLIYIAFKILCYINEMQLISASMQDANLMSYSNNKKLFVFYLNDNRRMFVIYGVLIDITDTD